MPKMLIQDLTRMLVYTCRYTLPIVKVFAGLTKSWGYFGAGFRGALWNSQKTRRIKNEGIPWGIKFISYHVKSMRYVWRMCQVHFSLISVISISASWLFKRTFGDIKEFFPSSTHWKPRCPPVFANKRVQYKNLSSDFPLDSSISLYERRTECVHWQSHVMFVSS